MGMKNVFFSLATVFLLTGCDQAHSVADSYVKLVNLNDAFSPPSLAISPGWKINDHGTFAEVYGLNRCPTSFGIVSQSGCVIIGQEEKNVTVFLIKHKAGVKEKTKELWTIERKGQYPKLVFKIKRPDGSFVIPWKEA
ncbi:hypothetical protein MPI44_004543 [Klebsiella oxytoca]|nr:hypothetical protein [Klebsiella oxytoca]